MGRSRSGARKTLRVVIGVNGELAAPLHLVDEEVLDEYVNLIILVIT